MQMGKDLATQRRKEQAKAANLKRKQRAQEPPNAAVDTGANKTQQVRQRKANSSSDPGGRGRGRGGRGGGRT